MDITNPHTRVICAGANPALRDWSGRKPHQYLANKDTSVSADTFRSEYANPLCEWYKLNYGTWRLEKQAVVLPNIVVTDGAATLPLARSKPKRKRHRNTTLGLLWAQ